MKYYVSEKIMSAVCGQIFFSLKTRSITSTINQDCYKLPMSDLCPQAELMEYFCNNFFVLTLHEVGLKNYNVRENDLSGKIGS